MTTPRAKIVIIEDEEILADVLKKKLEKDGYEVSVAVNGRAGLEVVDRASPDLILLDILMPEMDGYEVLSALQQKFGTAHMPPVIIISNSGQPVEIDRAINLGARDYIVKAQFTPEEVISKVNKLIGLKNEPRPMTEQAQTPAAPAPIVREARILIIEDDQFLRDLLTTKLQKETFEVSSAIDGPTGIEKILREKPDVVLLDIILPGLDGFEILKKVRSDSAMDIARIPIILLSNLGQEADVEKGRSLGADDYLIKSNFTIDEIIGKMRTTLATRKK